MSHRRCVEEAPLWLRPPVILLPLNTAGLDGTPQGRGEDEKGSIGPGSAVVLGTRCPAGIFPPALCLAASHLRDQEQ